MTSLCSDVMLSTRDAGNKGRKHILTHGQIFQHLFTVGAHGEGLQWNLCQIGLKAESVFKPKLKQT